MQETLAEARAERNDGQDESDFGEQPSHHNPSPMDLRAAHGADSWKYTSGRPCVPSTRATRVNKRRGDALIFTLPNAKDALPAQFCGLPP